MKIEMMNTYFDARIAECSEREQQLYKDDRKDEADFEKIRANIYGVFKTVLSAAQKSCGNNIAAVRNFYIEKLQQIPANWQVSYERAETYGDTEKMQIENIKLSTAKEIKAKFIEVWETEQ